MSAALVLAELAQAGAQLAAEPDGLRVRAPGRLPPELLARAAAAKPRLLQVASGAWRLDLAGWPGWRLDAYEERAAIRTFEGGMAVDLAERLAYLEALDLPEPSPVDGPELPPGTDPDAPEALALAAGVDCTDFPGLSPGPCPGCSAPTLAVTGLGACDGCGWARLPPPDAIEGAQLEIRDPAPRPRRPWTPAIDETASGGEDKSGQLHRLGAQPGSVEALAAGAAPAGEPLPEASPLAGCGPADIGANNPHPIGSGNAAAGTVPTAQEGPQERAPRRPRARTRAAAPAPVLSEAGQAALDGVRTLAAEVLGAELAEVRPLRPAVPTGDTGEAPAAAPARADRAAAPPVAPGSPSLALAPSGGLRPFRWSDAVPLPPARPRSAAEGPWPHPLDAPAGLSRGRGFAVELPAPPEMFAAAPTPAPLDESPAARAARFGYVITPEGQYIEAHRAAAPRRPPFLPRFDVRNRHGCEQPSAPGRPSARASTPLERAAAAARAPGSYPAGFHPAPGYLPPAPPPPGWGWSGGASCARCDRRGVYLGPRGHHCAGCDGLPPAIGAPEASGPAPVVGR